MKTKRIVVLLLIPAIILLIPLIVMQFSDEVNWTFFDFLVAGVLLTVTVFLSDLVWRKIRNIRHRIGIFVALFIVFFLIWAELAVGIFGTVFGGQ